MALRRSADVRTRFRAMQYSQGGHSGGGVLFLEDRRLISHGFIDTQSASEEAFGRTSAHIGTVVRDRKGRVTGDVETEKKRGISCRRRAPHGAATSGERCSIAGTVSHALLLFPRFVLQPARLSAPIVLAGHGWHRILSRSRLVGPGVSTGRRIEWTCVPRVMWGLSAMHICRRSAKMNTGQ